MASETPTRRPPFLAVVLNYLSYVFLFAICGVMLFLAWPVIHARLSGMPAVTLPTLPTAAIALPARPPAPLSAPLAAPALPGVAQNAATAQALYDAAVQAGEPLENTNLTNDPAPVVVQSKPVERMPAGENVPTAEPVAPAESGGIFGSKPVIVNVQETHECRHGQVWTEKGCKNPTPVGGG